ncbi:MAG: nucleoside deaminase [Planctomycetes bacterium]|nr:nucleoside deaminase [Planctomycetota bacterium]
MSDEDFMRQAIQLATTQMLADQGGPFGALIVHESRVISEGWNQVTSSNDPTAHAEIVAIRGAAEALGSYALADCDLFTSCEPCPMCLGAAYWAGVRRIVFAASRQDAAKGGFSDEFLYQELPKAIEDRQIPTIQLLGTEGWAPFAAWLAKEDRIQY